MTRMLIRFLDLIFNVWQSEQERRTSYRESLEITKNHFEKRLIPWHLRMTLRLFNPAWQKCMGRCNSVLKSCDRSCCRESVRNENNNYQKVNHFRPLLLEENNNNASLTPWSELLCCESFLRTSFEGFLVWRDEIIFCVMRSDLGLGPDGGGDLDPSASQRQKMSLFSAPIAGTETWDSVRSEE